MIENLSNEDLTVADVVVIHGERYISMKPVVEALGLDWELEVDKLRNKWTSYRCVLTVVSGESGVLCIPLTRLPGWMFRIDSDYVSDDMRDLIIQYQEECFDVLSRVD